MRALCRASTSASTASPRGCATADKRMDTPIATNSLVLGRILTRHARYRPHHPAVAFENQRLSYAGFNVLVNRWANALGGLGVVRGDRVATLLPNCLEGL